MSDTKKWLQAFGLFLAVSFIGGWLATIEQYFLIVLLFGIVGSAALAHNGEIARKAIGFALAFNCILLFTVALMIDSERLEETWGINLALLCLALLTGYGAARCFTWKDKR